MKDNTGRRWGDPTFADLANLPPTLPVPEAGRIFFGLGRDASYQAVARGDIPSLRIGRRIVVPTARCLDLIGVRHAD